MARGSEGLCSVLGGTSEFRTTVLVELFTADFRPGAEVRKRHLLGLSRTSGENNSSHVCSMSWRRLTTSNRKRPFEQKVRGDFTLLVLPKVTGLEGMIDMVGKVEFESLELGFLKGKVLVSPEE